MRALRALAVITVAVWAVACASGEPDSRSTTVTPPGTTAMVAPPSTSVPARPSRTAPPDVTLVPPPTTITTTTIAFADDMTLGAPIDPIPGALPAASVPWSDVDAEWLAFAFPRSASEPPDARSLYLVDPDDRIYGVAALSDAIDDILGVSWPGRVALVRGTYADGLPLSVIDLETTTLHQVVPRGEGLELVSLTRDGTGLWVYVQASADQHLANTRVSRIDLATRTSATVFDESVVIAPGGVNSRNGLTELPNGEIVLGTATGIWVGDPATRDYRPLRAPDSPTCAVIRAWSDSAVLVGCQIPDREPCDYGPAGLWLVATDGAAATPLALPEEGKCTSYHDAAAVAGQLAVDVTFGPGECNSGVVMIGPHASEQWRAPVAAVDCNEWVVGVRNDAWLVTASNPYVEADFPIVQFEVTPDRTTEVDLPNTWVLPLGP